ncbi:uncharacterized protein JCM15063_002640 [Sporobolomyces koalae]|uniref:uncharacterized protein n=1 Tax=Sporobolomyces koalae TaxID=500713 RepID=UPI003172D7CD
MPAERVTGTSGGRGKDAKQTRSRAGCLTCRQRHKKCDETRLAENNGACKRCFSGSWECTWPPAPGDRPLKSFKGSKHRVRTADGNSATASVAGSGDEDDQGVAEQYPRGANRTRSMPSSDAYGSTPVDSSASQPPVPYPAPAPYSLPYPTPSSYYSQPIPTLQPLPPPVPLPSLPNQPNTDLNDFFASLDAELGYWQTLGQETHDSGASAEFTTMPMPGDPDAELPMQVPPASAQAFPRPPSPALSAPPPPPPPPPPDPQQHVPEPETTQILQSQPAREAPPTSPTAPVASATHTSQTREESAMRASHEPASSPPDEPVVVDPMYNNFNEAFFRSLPKPVRDIVVKRLYGLANSHELSRNASMAMVMLYRLRMQSSAEENAEAVASSTDARARLLAQSDVYFQRAMEHLQKPIPFEAKLVATLDMQAYQFDQFGAAAANAILLLMEYFIHEALGAQPALDLSALRSSVDVLYAAFAWTDCIRCMCDPKRRTIFALSNLPGDASSSSPSTVLADVNPTESHSIETHLGLPVGLLLCIAATANLSAEMEALPDEVVKFKGEAIEKAIRNWRSAPQAADNNDSAAYIEKVATAEMWRYACILFLYQTVFRHGALSTVVRTALQQILQIGARVLGNHPIQTSSIRLPEAANGTRSASDPSYEDYFNACSTRAVPWFLAATVAVLPADRDLCKKGLSICGKQKGYQDNLNAVERIWEVVDAQGWVVDWRALLQSEKISVGFL